MEHLVIAPPPGSFDALLRACRHRACLSQERLAARAEVSGSSPPSDRACVWRAGSGISLGYLAVSFWWWRASPAIPVPVGYPDCGRTRASVSFLPLETGLGETDWTLAALQNAAASSAGPGTWLLVGMALGGTGCRTFYSGPGVGPWRCRPGR